METKGGVNNPVENGNQEGAVHVQYRLYCHVLHTRVQYNTPYNTYKLR